MPLKGLKRKPNENKPTGSPPGWRGDGTVEREWILISVSWHTATRRENGGGSGQRRALFWALGYSILIGGKTNWILVNLQLHKVITLLYFSSHADKFLLIYTTEFHIFISISTLKLRKSLYLPRSFIKYIILELVLIIDHEIQILNNKWVKWIYSSNLQWINNFTKKIFISIITY